MAVIEQRYAQALADLAASGAVPIDALRRELAELAETWRGAAPLRALLESPAVRWENKQAVLEAVAARLRLSPLTRNFLLVAAQRGRAGKIEGIALAFEQLLLERQGVVRADVTSARPLAPAERAGIEAALAQRLGRQLQVRYQEDPALMGGFMARVADQIFDASLNGRLHRLRLALMAA